MEKLVKEKAEKEEEHVAEIVEVINEVKSSTIEAVWEAKIKMAYDVENAGSWNVAGWHEALAKLTGGPLKEEEKKIEKTQAGDDQAWD